MISLGEYMVIYQSDHRIILMNGDQRGIVIQDRVRWRDDDDVLVPSPPSIQLMMITTTIVSVLHTTTDHFTIQRVDVDAKSDRIISRLSIVIASELIIKFALHPSHRYLIVAMRSGIKHYHTPTNINLDLKCDH